MEFERMPHGPDPFLLQLFVIFIWTKIFGELFEQLALPAVLGEILAGVILGPYFTGFIHPSDAVNSIGEVGAIFLLFTVGLETSPKDLIRVGTESITVAVAGITLPFICGFTYMMLRDEPAHLSTFVAAAMVATSVGITARVLGDLRVLHTRAARIILGAAVFDDILGMVLLGIVVGIVSVGGVKWVQLGTLFAEAIGFALFMIFYAPRLVHHMRPGLRRMSSQNAPLILSLAICLGFSVLAERVGMAAIIGAFFAGLAFAEYSPEWNLRSRVTAINEFLAPYFFFVMGAQLNLHVFTSTVVISAIVISILAIISKLVGCGLPVIYEGWETALKVGVGMVPRGEVGLIVALVGLQMKMITQSAYAIVIVMTAVTTLFAPILLRMLFRKDARQRAEDQVRDPKLQAEAPAGHVS